MRDWSQRANGFADIEIRTRSWYRTRHRLERSTMTRAPRHGCSSRGNPFPPHHRTCYLLAFTGLEYRAKPDLSTSDRGLLRNASQATTPNQRTSCITNNLISALPSHGNGLISMAHTAPSYLRSKTTSSPATSLPEAQRPQHNSWANQAAGESATPSLLNGK